MWGVCFFGFWLNITVCNIMFTESFNNTGETTAVAFFTQIPHVSNKWKWKVLSSEVVVINFRISCPFGMAYVRKTVDTSDVCECPILREIVHIIWE